MGEVGHTGLVAEDRSAGATAGGIDGQHREPVPLIDHMEPEGFDEGGLADTGRTGDPDPDACARAIEDRLEHLVGHLAMLGTRGFGERDGPGQ